MVNEDKICCWLSWNLFLRIIIFFILLGIPFGLYKPEKIGVIKLFSGLGVIVGFYLFYQRNKIFEKQLIQKDEQYIKDSQFKNFLDATKMLTDKDSAIESKISSLFLLYDVANYNPENIDRIIQVINKNLTPLINCIEGNCDVNSYKKRIVSSEMNSHPRNKKITFQHTTNNVIKIDINDKNLKKIIKEWQYNGNDTEKLISVSLYIIRKIILKILPQIDDHIEISNTIIFDLDTDYDKKLKFNSKERPTENIIFLNCKLHAVDFKETIYHQASFINCDLVGSDFSGGTLWGALFENCNLENTKFNKTECEATEFKKCKKLKIEQIESMEFKNKKGNKKYLLILPDNNLDIKDEQYFKTLEDFNKWRYPDD